MRTIKLNVKQAATVKPIAPLNFDATVFKPSHYPDPTEIYEPGKYWFAMRLGNKIYGIKLVNRGTVKSPKIQINVFSDKALSPKTVASVLKEIGYRLEFDRDISDFFKRFKKDKVLSPFLRRWHGMHHGNDLSLYELLMIGIFLQNTIIRRSVQMTEAVLKKYGTKVRFDGREVYAFWKPEDMAKASEKAVRRLKVGYRARIFVKLSESFVKEKIDELKLRQLPVDEAKRELLKLYGVGPETARILLESALHHYEMFDHVAPWQQKIYSRLLFNSRLVPVSKIIKYIQGRWGKWAGLASHYIWEDIFWQRKQGKKIAWLEKEIRL